MADKVQEIRQLGERHVRWGRAEDFESGATSATKSPLSSPSLELLAAPRMAIPPLLPARIEMAHTYPPQMHHKPTMSLLSLVAPWVALFR